MKLKTDQKLQIRSMGKLLTVTAMFHDTQEANQYMERHPDEGVVAEFKPYIFIANLYDQGSPERSRRGE